MAETAGFWGLRECCSCTPSFKPPEDQPGLVPMGAGLGSSEGVVVKAFEGDGRPHTDASCGVLWVLWRHPGPQETPTRGPAGPLLLQGACTCVLPGGFRVQELPSPPPTPSPASGLEASIQASRTPNSGDLG